MKTIDQIIEFLKSIGVDAEKVYRNPKETY
ncbi:Uncharacterised protein [Mycobacteroides abscessus subsp. abscessus]|nr:hypothetical protein BACSP_03556 [Bacillus sp. T2.9-1]SLL31945.1 Uncharacterised protein [Mycobacteroides abscessus subsp. abscessus]